MHKSLRGLKFSDLVLFEDDDFILVNKPPFLSSLEDRNDPSNLLQLAREQNADIQVCHRLDKETSGIMVLAKHNDAYKHFADQLQNREVKKVYHAVLGGLHHFDNFEADEPLFTTSSKSRVDLRQGKPSLTLVQTLEAFKKHTLVKCFPVTGRMHQIRAHLAHHEAPIIHDSSYGGSTPYLSELKKDFKQKKWEDERPMIGRVALHSTHLAFRGIKDKIIEMEAPYPKDFTVLLKLLRKYC